MNRWRREVWCQAGLRQWLFALALCLSAAAVSLHVPRWIPNPIGVAIAQDDADDDLEDELGDDLEQEIEDDIESSIEQDVEDSIEQGIEEEIEASIEEEIEASIEEEIEAGIEDDIEDDVESEIEGDIESDVENDIEEGIENEIENETAGEIEDDVEDDAQGNNKSLNADRLFDVDLDEDGEEKLAEEQLLLLDQDSVDLLTDRGYQILQQDPLRSMGLILVRIEAPETLDPEEELTALKLSGDDNEIDFNHLYRPQQSPKSLQSESKGAYLPASFGSANPLWSKTRQNIRGKIGLIDTQVDTDHPALKWSKVKVRDFAFGRTARPIHHGTAIASILVGSSETYQGLLPNASLYAASVFLTHPSNGQMAPTDSLVRAVDWMVSNRVRVVNMSFAGPPNRVLAAVLEQAAGRGVTFAASSGNAGPTAEPLYPAAYDQVAAITAVDSRNRVYRKAVRGPHIDFAAPGVNILCAGPAKKLVTETGTSMAVPFAVSVFMNRCAKRRCKNTSRLISDLKRSSVDLGATGFDHSYGHGLIQP